MYETPEVEKMDSKTGPIPVVVNFAAVVDNVVAAVYDAVVAAYAFWYSADNDGTRGKYGTKLVANPSSNHLAYRCMRLTAQP